MTELNLALYLGLLPTVLGFIVLSTCFYYMFFNHSREKFWGCFIAGSFLMGSGLVCGITLTEDLKGYSILAFGLSAVAWIVHGLIFLGCTGYLDKFKTAEEIFNTLDGEVVCLSPTGDNDITGYYACWDSYYSQGSNFRFRLVEIYKVNTYMNKFKKEQHYARRHIERKLKSVEECKEYLGKFKNTPVKL